MKCENPEIQVVGLRALKELVRAFSCDNDDNKKKTDTEIKAMLQKFRVDYMAFMGHTRAERLHLIKETNTIYHDSVSELIAGDAHIHEADDLTLVTATKSSECLLIGILTNNITGVQSAEITMFQTRVTQFTKRFNIPIPAAVAAELMSITCQRSTIQILMGIRHRWLAPWIEERREQMAGYNHATEP